VYNKLELHQQKNKVAAKSCDNREIVKKVCRLKRSK